MPPGEEMFKFHGYSGPCPKPPIVKAEPDKVLLTEKIIKDMNAEGNDALLIQAVVYRLFEDGLIVGKK